MAKEKEYTEFTPDFIANYLDAHGDNKFRSGLLLAHHFMFENDDMENARKIIQEMGGIVTDAERSVTSEIRKFIDVTDGYFTLQDVYKELHLVTKQDKTTARVAIKREYDKGLIEKHGNRDGTYRKPNYEMEDINLLDGTDEPYSIEFPLDLHKHVLLYHGDVAVVAGKWNAGKSAFLLETARLNMKEQPVWFFTSEMKAPRFRKRIARMEDTTLEEFAEFVTVKSREGGFHDVIQPDALNLIDYLQINEDFYRVGAQIREIAERLKTGVAIVALQKNAAATYGYGAEKGLQRPTLYITIDDGVLKIIKAKDWAVEDANPNGKIQYFKLYKGVNFKMEGVLHHEGDDPKESK